jgi:hypothetical protein
VSGESLFWTYVRFEVIKEFGKRTGSAWVGEKFLIKIETLLYALERERERALINIF